MYLDIWVIYITEDAFLNKDGTSPSDPFVIKIQWLSMFDVGRGILSSIFLVGGPQDND